MKEHLRTRYMGLLAAPVRPGKIKVISLEAMTKRYDKGELDPKVN